MRFCGSKNCKTKHFFFQCEPQIVKNMGHLSRKKYVRTQIFLVHFYEIEKNCIFANE